MIKNILKGFFNSLGYEITRKPQASTPSEKKKYSVESPHAHNTAENMNQFFSDKENLDSYVSGRQEFYNKLADKILEQNLNFNEAAKICDVGCGPADLLNIISQKINRDNISFYGFDHSEKLLEIGKERFKNINFNKFNIFEDSGKFIKNFDTVICSEVVEHLDEPKKAILNLMSMVKENGLLIITVPEGRMDNYLGHINFWSPESWRQFVKEISVENNCSVKTDLIKTNKGEFNLAAFKKTNQ